VRDISIMLWLYVA